MNAKKNTDEPIEIETIIETTETTEPAVIQSVVSASQRRWTLNPKQLKWLAIGAVLVLAAALGYFIWYKPNQPNAVLARSLMNTLQLESAHFNLAIGTAATQGSDKAVGVKAVGQVSSKGSLSLSGSYTSPNAVGSPISFKVQSSDGKDIYARFSGLATLGSVLGPAAALYGVGPQSNPFQSLDGKWLVIPKGTTDSLLKNAQLSGSNTQLSDDDKQKIARLYQRHEFIVVTKTLADESIDGVPSRHYQAKFNKAALGSFVEAVQKDVPALKLTAQQIQSISTASVPSEPFDVWITKASQYVNRLQYRDSQAKDSKAMTLRLDLSQCNQPVQVDTPKDAVPLFEALGGLLLGAADKRTYMPN